VLRGAHLVGLAAGVFACGSATAPIPDTTDADVPDAAPPAIDAAPPTPPMMAEMSLDCLGAEIPDEPKIPCTLVIEDGMGGLVYDGAAYVEQRGRSSIAFAKPQYSVELRTSLDTELEDPVDLFGMGSEADWIFNGAYIDRALFRNVVLFEIFQSFGATERYAPQIRYAELTLDGDYRGIYMLTERVKRDFSRLPIMGSLDGSSFVLKQDETEGIRAVGFANGHWRLIYPHRDRASQLQRDGVVNWLSTWSGVINGTITDVPIFDLVDLDSVVDFVLLEEFAKNVDAYFLSMHVWKDVGGKLHFTPWDLDLSFGQPDYGNAESPAGWIEYRPWLITSLAQHEEFRSRLAERWAELRQDQLSRETIFARIDWHLVTIADHIDANFERWPIDEIQFLDDTLYTVESHAEELDRVRTWIDSRLEWMDENIESFAP